MDKERRMRFIDEWGAMGSAWGINASMARVHALLMVTEGAVSLDDIAKVLEISRGNASMCLKELRSWGVVRRVKKAGDRQDYYQSEPDVWKMFFAIARERKRREFDPAIRVLREVVGKDARPKGGEVEKRLRQMEEFLTTMDRMAEMFLADEEKGRAVLNFLTAGAAGKKG